MAETSGTGSTLQGSAGDQGSLLYIMLISGVATIGGFLFGFDSGVINGTVDGLKVAFNSNSVGTGFDVASMLLGCAVGAFFAGWLADKFGRRAVLLVSAVFFIVSAWGSGIATSSPEFIIYRVIGGIAVGAASVMAPAYISEVARAEYRGRMATVQQVAIIVGLTAAFLSNYLLAHVSGSALKPLWWGYETWRWMFWIELFPAGFFLLALLFIPESPRYLAAVGKREAAQRVLTRLYGAAEAQSKLDEIGRSLAQSKLFPAMVIHLISSGEASGELDNMLERAASHQESEMDSLLATMLSVLEPLLIVFMGLVVLAIVMAILLPIFQINQLVR